jgi:iron complex transport system permease protein
VVILALSWGQGLVPMRFVLVGIGIGFVLFAGVDFLLTRAEQTDAATVMRWWVGSLNASGWDELRPAVLLIGPLMVAGLWIGPRLDRLALGTDMATGLGVPVIAVRVVAALAGALAVALAVFLAGPVPFVAFSAGPIARRISGGGGAALMTSVLMGALIVTLADLAARFAFAPVQMPVGLFTAAIGAPVLLFILVRRSTRESL